MAKVLVVGGAGYVGSTTCVWLLRAGHQVWVLDDLSTGHFELVVRQGHQVQLIVGQAGDRELLQKLYQEHQFDCVMHFAAKSLVNESMTKSAEYFENNVLQTRILLKTLLPLGLRCFVFSSSCAIFGDPHGARIHEELPKIPLSPYGQNKLDVEQDLEKFARNQDLLAIALRYFNAAGAEPELKVGEWHEPESHLIPRIFEALQFGKAVEIYGTDYSTRDGTCVRDYVHVWDLAEAHALAMERLLTARGQQVGQQPSGMFEAYNLGSEQGYSVREVIAACEKVSGEKINIQEMPRRAGDPDSLVAESSRAASMLGFHPKQTLEGMLSSAWNWEKTKKTILRKAIFLDRDGTLNEDPGYLSDPSGLKLLPLVGEALKILKKAGYIFIVVSNQSGVGRGLIDRDVIPKIHDRLDALLKPWGVRIAQYQLCFHLPVENCECRKPKPKLILDAIQTLQIHPAASYFIGDRETDLRAGLAAGLKGALLVRTGDGAMTEKLPCVSQASFVGDSLLEVAQWIVSQKNESP